MKKFILLIALSVLLYSAPGYAGLVEGEAAVAAGEETGLATARRAAIVAEARVAEIGAAEAAVAAFAVDPAVAEATTIVQAEVQYAAAERAAGPEAFVIWQAVAAAAAAERAAERSEGMTAAIAQGADLEAVRKAGRRAKEVERRRAERSPLMRAVAALAPADPEAVAAVRRAVERERAAEAAFEAAPEAAAAVRRAAERGTAADLETLETLVAALAVRPADPADQEVPARAPAPAAGDKDPTE